MLPAWGISVLNGRRCGSAVERNKEPSCAPTDLHNYMRSEEQTQRLIERTKREIMPKLGRMLSNFDACHKSSDLTDEQVFKVLREGMNWTDERYKPEIVQKIEVMEEMLADTPENQKIVESAHHSPQVQRRELRKEIERLKREELGWVPTPAKP